MTFRDLAIVGAVVVLGGFAVADAFRANGGESPREAGTTATSERRTSERRGSVPETFAAVRAPGSLVFTDADDCRLREVSVATGTEFPLPPIATSCELWAPPAGERLAYGLGGSFGPAVPFRFVDLNHVRRDLGAFQALRGIIAWSGDGQRAGWCDHSGKGFDYELGRELRRVRGCPRAYAPDSRPISNDGSFLRGHRGRVFRSSGHVDLASFGRDGSLALLVDGERFERWQDGRRTASTPLPAPLAGRLPILSPDNCAALFQLGPSIHLVELACFRGRNSFTNVSPDNCLDRRRVTIARCARFRSPRTFVGTAAAWSPDGRWLAVAADEGTVLFHRVVGRYDVVRWDASARALAWLG